MKTIETLQDALKKISIKDIRKLMRLKYISIVLLIAFSCTIPEYYDFSDTNPVQFVNVCKIGNTEPVSLWGDSRIYMFYTENYQGDLNFTTYNYAIGGYTIRMIKEKMYRNEFKSKKIFIQVGINDAKKEYFGQSVYDFIFEYQETINYIKSKKPDAEIYIGSVIKINKHLVKYMKGKNPNPLWNLESYITVNLIVDDYNNKLKQLCLDNNLIYINCEKMHENNQLNLNYDKDGIHYNAAGNRQLINILNRGFL